MIRPSLAVAVALLAVTTPLQSLHAQLGRDDATFTWSKRLAPGTSFVLRSANGPITIRQGSGDLLEVRAVKTAGSRGSIRDVAFDVRESSGQVEICTLLGGQTSCRDRNGTNNVRVRVDFTVMVPKSLRLHVSTGNGAINIDHAGADVSATTGNGDVTIGETEGRVDVTTGNGDVQVDGANGPVTVTSGNGKIFVLTAHGGVDANTGNGDVDVRIKGGPLDGDMRFNSGSGSIRVTLPSDFNGRVDASTGSGNLRSDFEIGVIGRLDARHVRGTIGRGGGPLLRLNTGSGTIELRKG